MAYMSHGRADAESLLEFMDSQRWPPLEILVIFLGQPMLAKVRDSCYFLGSANVGRSQRFFSDISLNSKSWRKLDKYMRCDDWNIINETIRAQGLANAHI